MITKQSLSTLLILILIQVLSVSAQESRIIKGKVSTFGAIPLNNVKITTSKSKQVEYTDYMGFFSISATEKDVIRLYALGFDTKKFRAKKVDSLYVDLVYSNTETSFEEAINGDHVSREVLEDAITRYPLKGEKDYTRYSTIYELIKTEIYNVKVTGTSITPTVPTSINAGQKVLLVVNGTTVTDISYIYPTDVKSIRYVDGPEAARYGIRGANGVIEITLR